MLIKQLNREDAEELFVSAQNATGEVVSVGAMLCWDWRKAASHGNAVVKPTTSGIGLFAGVLAYGQPDYTNWPINAYGLIQVYGVHGSLAYNVGSASVSCAGRYLIPINGAYSGQTTDISGVGLSLTSQTYLLARGAFILSNDLSGVGWTQAFVRAL